MFLRVKMINIIHSSTPQCSLDILEARVNGAMMIKILASLRRLKEFSWTLDGQKVMKVANRLHQAQGNSESTGKPDIENARRTLKNVTRMKLAGSIESMQIGRLRLVVGFHYMGRK